MSTMGMRLPPLVFFSLLVGCNAERDEPASANEVEAAVQRAEREMAAADASKPAAQKHARPSAAIPFPN